jgi:hypothetical protein
MSTTDAEIGGTPVDTTNAAQTATYTQPPASGTAQAGGTTNFERAVVAAYKSHADAEEAVRMLDHAGIPMNHVSIIGRDFQLREDIQGYYRPADAALEGAGAGAWMGGLFGLLWGFGFFLIPVAGPLFALGPIAGLIAGAVGGAGVGALIGALTTLGIPKDEALKYQARLQAGEFLTVVQGTVEQVERAREVLHGTRQVDLQTHYTGSGLKAAA